MNVAIDARALIPQPTGIGVYLKHLLDEYAQMTEEHTYYLLSSRNICYTAPANLARFNRIEQYGLPGNIWLQLQVPKLLKRLGIDIFHSPFGVIPFRCPCASVITVHDLTFHFYPKLTDIKNRLLLPRLIPKSLNRATAIIVDSKAIKNELVELYKIRENQIEVIHLAPSSFSRLIPKETARKYLAERYGIQSRFILFVGTLEPRKNIEVLLKTYHQLPTELREKYQLVLVGKKGWQYQSIFKLIDELNLQNQIIFMNYVSEEDLPFFYNAAAVFVYPSLYEGFGLPLVDALACGTPIITSKISSMPEVVSYAGILIDPKNESELIKALSRLLTDQELANHLSEKALSRAHHFSWQDTARKTFEVYRNAVRKFTVQQFQSK
ncbi:MAG: glycosyltransferase family 4 protein [bacterium]|nr:glycosyltransferase family 4 protein [bacterium]